MLEIIKIMKEQNEASLQNIILSHEKQIFIYLRKFKCYSLLSKLLIKIKRSDFFTINNNMQKLNSWKLFTKSSFCNKQLMKLKVCGCKTSSSFPWAPLKVH